VQSGGHVFTLLERDGWVPSELSARLAAMAGFRNVLVHGYDDVDLAVVRDVLISRLGDLDAFVQCIRQRLKDDSGDPGGRSSSQG